MFVAKTHAIVVRSRWVRKTGRAACMLALISAMLTTLFLCCVAARSFFVMDSILLGTDSDYCTLIANQGSIAFCRHVSSRPNSSPGPLVSTWTTLPAQSAWPESQG